MHFFENSKIFVSFGTLKITWYAVLILTGAFIGYMIAQKTVKKWGYAKEMLEDYIIPTFIIAILGARVYYVIFEWGYYSTHLNEIIAIWNGGLAIHGGLIAGLLYSIYFFKKRNVSCLRMADAIMPSVMVGQVFGRWGNFMNQEAFGRIVPESFFDHFPSFIKNQMYINGAYHEPTFLYESIGNLIGFLFIYFIFRKKFYKRHGDCAFMYLVWYGVVRFFIEGLRTDSLMLDPIRVAQLVSLIMIVIGILGLSGIFHKVFHLYQKPVVLFDLDGTLIDSRELVFETFIQVFKEEKPDYVLSKEELYSFFGPTLETTFSKYFEEKDVDRIIERYQTINRQLHDKLLKPIDHAKETVKWLHDQGYKIAVVSNKRHAMVEKGLKTSALYPYFEVIMGKEDLPKPKPSASGLIEATVLLHTGHDNTIYVGDNAADVMAAKDMAAYSIGFSNDAKQVEKLEEAKPCRIIKNLSELKEIVKEEQSWSDKSIW